MDIIQLLPDSVANQIAAGEVIQRPSSVVKELVENSIDAGATEITIIIKDAGRTLVQVIDNGKGMSMTDARLSFERHATSKIRNSTDLFALNTMGFRGEALASIAAIAHVELRTRRAEDEVGTLLTIAGSKVESQEPISTPVGANFSVKDIFYNVPARRKFLKSNQVEFSNILTEFERIALANPQITFTLCHNGTEVYKLHSASLLQRVVSLFGKTMNTQMLAINVKTSLVTITGFVGKPENARKRGAQQFFFVNGRYMRHPYFHKAVINAYEDIIPVGEMPNYVIKFEVEPSTIDVNIHPTKTEIKFENEQHIWPILLSAVKEALGKFSAVPSIDFDTEDAPEIPIFKPNMEVRQPQVSYTPGYNPFKYNNGAVSKASTDWQKLYDNFGTAQSPKTEFDTSADSELFFSQQNDRVEESHEQSLIPTETSVAAYMQIKGRYIVTSIKSGMVLVDQHRAHTRILYEKYIANIEKNTQPVQKILFPEIIQLSPAQTEILSAIESELSSVGFEISNLGGGSFSVTGVPEGSEGLNYQELLHKFIDIATETGTTDTTLFKKKMAQTLAKSAAIPYGQVLTPDEMDYITQELFKLPEANYTPDGKPTLTCFTNDELEKRFK
ncbi:MAG: DNA mismatch repair endonuclease MutL [Muribaculaceae bacterium]|nr:DNA mismatch repair endonuclease MutL [Muribaculaceae bacterium]